MTDWLIHQLTYGFQDDDVTSLLCQLMAAKTAELAVQFMYSLHGTPENFFEMNDSNPKIPSSHAKLTSLGWVEYIYFFFGKPMLDLKVIIDFQQCFYADIRKILRISWSVLANFSAPTTYFRATLADCYWIFYRHLS